MACLKKHLDACSVLSNSTPLFLFDSMFHYNTTKTPGKQILHCFALPVEQNTVNPQRLSPNTPTKGYLPNRSDPLTDCFTPSGVMDVELVEETPLDSYPHLGLQLGHQDLARGQFSMGRAG